MSQSIRKAADMMIRAEVLAWDRVATLQSLDVSLEFNAIALDESSSYERVYLAGLALRQFNFLLVDHSYVQLSHSDQVIRFSYYPNPFTDPDGLLDMVDDPLDFDSINIVELGATAGRAPLRYDYSVGQYVELTHPCAHFHLGHGELGRLASKRVFCPLTFCLLVMRLYYPIEWGAFSTEVRSANGFLNELDEMLAAGLTRNGWVNVAYFTQVEDRFVHFR